MAEGLSVESGADKRVWSYTNVPASMFMTAAMAIPVPLPQSDTSSRKSKLDSLRSFMSPADSLRLRTTGAGANKGRNGRTIAPMVPADVKYNVDIDAARNRLRVSESIYDNPYNESQALDLDEYIERRKDYIKRDISDSIAHYYDLDKALSNDELSNILNQATNLIIPIPPNPLSGLFGKPEISINVSGEVNVTGGWRWDSQNLGTSSAFGQTQSGPIFNQDIKVAVNGRIGDKFNLGVDWSSRRQFEFDNKFRVGFDGYDDDIIKKIEVGNVQLNSGSTLIGGSQALFGVAADFQFGPVYLKTIASQKRGQRRFVELKGGRLAQTFNLHAYDYAENHFFLDTAYKTAFSQAYTSGSRIIPSNFGNLRIKEIEVWESVRSAPDAAGSDAKEAVAIANIEAISADQRYPATTRGAEVVLGEVERGNFRRLTQDAYEYDEELGILTILSLRRDRTYAVAYRVENGPSANDDLKYGEFSAEVGTDEVIALRLIYRQNLQPGFRTLWDRQLRNIYSLPVNNVNLDQTRISIWYFRNTNDSADVLQGAPQKIVTILGVDRTNNESGDANPDGLFDVRNPFIFNRERGEIMFPNLEPFRDQLVQYFANTPGLNQQQAERYVYGAVYDTTKEVARQQTERDRFLISGEAAGSSGARITLPNGFNVAQGSVRVTLDGQPLREGSDYTVEYFSGTVTLRNPQASLPNANVTIEYEQNDIFNLSTRTLLGVRADLDMNYLIRSREIKSNLGFTAMMFDQALQVDRVQVGEEPVSNSMVGFDGQMTWTSDAITRTLDKIPFLDVKEPSSLTVRGEVAWMLPDPNKKKSEIPDDGGESVAYIDDFEGAQRYIPLGLTATQWQHSSPPVDSSIAFDLEEVQDFRGRIFWWRYFIPRTPVREVYPERDFVSSNSNLSDLYVWFIPDERGIYNRNEAYTDSSDFTKYSNQTATGQRERIWGGMQRLLSSFNTNFDTDNIDYIELMMNVELDEPGTEMYIDLGQISEDIIPNQQLDTEDGFTAESPFPNDIIDEGEDLGIDQLSNELERQLYPASLVNDANEDPARDDYFFDFDKTASSHQPLDFLRFNNFEGNATIAQTGQFPDTEILNDNNGQSIMLDNSFFRYRVNLDRRPETNPQIVGGNEPWFLYRIPIRGPRQSFGNPLFSNVQYVRVWWKGGNFKGRIAEWRLAGSQWQRFEAPPSDSDTDTTIQIAFVSVEENSGAPDFYQMPPGVTAPRQLNNPDPTQDVRLNEQSLSICVENLAVGEERTAVRFFNNLDVFYYKRLKFFIHGDGSMPVDVTPGATPPAVAYLRFGTDSLNYYEFSRPLTQGWTAVDISLQELTGIKQQRNANLAERRQEFPAPNDPLATYAVRGYPTLTNLQLFGFGIRNPDGNQPNELSTCMWVNELRLINAEDRSDLSWFVNSQLKLSDFGNASFNYRQVDPNFHRLEEQFGNRIQRREWAFNFSAGLEKFLPNDWRGAAIPFTLTHNERLENPEYVSQSDLNLEEAALAAERGVLESGGSVEEARNEGERVRRASETVIVEDSWALTGIRLGLPSNAWYIRDLFNRVTVGYSQSQRFERSPVVAERRQWQWDLTTKYNITIPPNFTLEPFGFFDGVPVLEWYKDFKISLLPSNFSTGLTMSRGRTTEQSRFLDIPSPVVRRFSATREAQLSWKLTEGGLLNTTLDYSLSGASTLVGFELDENNQQRSGGDIFSRVMFNNGKFIDLGRDINYNQNVTLNFKPAVPPILGIERFLTATGSFSTNYTWDNQLQNDPLIEDITKSATFNNTIRFGLNFRLKSLADEWWGIESGGRSRFTGRGRNNPDRDTTATDTTDSGGGLFGTVGLVFKSIFLDYDNVTINFRQNNTARNPGILGANGMNNLLWGAPLYRDDKDLFGPSAAYQLGLISNPHGGFKMASSSSFPFIGFETFPGRRPANATLQDNFAQQNEIELRTSRPLWDRATLDLNWRSQFGFNRNQTVTTGADGIPVFSNITVRESYNRTFLSLPRWFGLGLFGADVENVIDEYNNRRAEIELDEPDTLRRNERLAQALAESFTDEMESFTFLPNPIRRILPRLNWTLRWEGLEDFWFFGGLARRVSLEHRYQSTYQENILVNDQGREIEAQSIDMAFQPLIGLNFQFDQDKLDGNLSAKLRYNTRTTYRVSTAGRSINEDNTRDFSLEASYAKRGFNLPLFGMNLENDIEFGFTAQWRNTSRAVFDIEDTENPDGNRLDGSTQIIIEPSARYTISRRVRARGFFRYEANLNEGAATPGNTVTQVGLEVSISIAGGR